MQHILLKIRNSKHIRAGTGLGSFVPLLVITTNKRPCTAVSSRECIFVRERITQQEKEDEESVPICRAVVVDFFRDREDVVRRSIVGRRCGRGEGGSFYGY